jgi:transposase
MARRSFQVMDITEILVHWYAGRSQVEMSDSLGLDRKTVRKYLAPAIEAGFAPGGPAMGEEDWRVLVRSWFPELADTSVRQVTWPAIAVHRDYIVAMMAAGVHASTIHQRLRDEHGLSASIASFRRYVAANLPEEATRNKVTVLALHPTTPGEVAQIDYGRLGTWTDPRTGRRHRVEAFVMVLAHSRHMFVRPVLTLDQESWTRAHVLAFEFFGGTPARLVPDNLKTGVDRPDLYDPRINRSYAELAGHYGALVDPARAARPKDKPRVERQMPYIRDSWWRGREFASLEEMQKAATVWCLEVAGVRRHRGLDGAAPLSVFNAAEAGVLLPLPRSPFTLAVWSKAKVGPDIHVKVGKALYSVPWKLIGQSVDARSAALTVQIFHNGELVKTHVRTERKQTDLGDYPEEKIAFHMRTPVWCRQKAAGIGPACTGVIEALFEVNALYRLRAAQGVLRLADKYGASRLEAACRKAAEAGDPSYRTIKGVLAAGLEHDPVNAGPGDGGAPAFLRGPSQLFADVIPLGNAGADTVQDTVEATGATVVPLAEAAARLGVVRKKKDAS